ncbi:hypothetical protein LPW11_00685 [Geomonas sp. RF6]|nr:hypothetical protein LPW11_00685 [Geomonas sp. RF6]
MEAACATNDAVISMACDPYEVPLGRALRQSHAVLKEKRGAPPAVVLAGGVPDRPEIVFFYRPLAAADFGMLWWGKGGGKDRK